MIKNCDNYEGKLDMQTVTRPRVEIEDRKGFSEQELVQGFLGSIPGNWNSMCKGPEVRQYLTWLRNLKKANRTDVQSIGWKMLGDKGTVGPGGSGPWESD